MATPIGEEKPLFKNWGKLKKQWGAKGVYLRVRGRGGDVDGKYDPKTNIVTLNQQRINETAKRNRETPNAVARRTLRHEFAHYRAELADPGSTLSTKRTHGRAFKRAEKQIGGTREKPKSGRRFIGKRV